MVRTGQEDGDIIATTQLVSDCNGYAKTVGKTKKEKETRTGRKHEREVNLQRVETKLFKTPATPCNTVKKKCITEGNSLSSAEVKSSVLTFKEISLN